MCRYAMSGPYKEKWACFECRKSFRKTNRWEIHARPVPLAEDGERLVLCPQCGQRMNDMGLDFKAPRQNDIEQWKKVELLFANGYAFHSCGCNGPGPHPARLNEVPTFVAQEQQARELRQQKRANQLMSRRKRKRHDVHPKEYFARVRSK